jgi:hypothetical protein
MREHNVMTLSRRHMRGAIAAMLWLLATASMAHAHGGIAGPDELGPPVITSTMLGIACYWIVMLWPSRRPRNGSKNGHGNGNGNGKMVRKAAR